jgi:hypothetical protein
MALTPHLTHFEGGNALSDFRAQALLARLQTVSARITGISARAVHWVWTDAPLDGAARDQFAALLTYGEPAAAGAEGALVVVTPRFGTVSPWASRAIAAWRSSASSASSSTALRPRPACSAAPSRSAPTNWTPAPRCCTTA